MICESTPSLSVLPLSRGSWSVFAIASSKAELSYSSLLRPIVTGMIVVGGGVFFVIYVLVDLYNLVGVIRVWWGVRRYAGFLVGI